MKLLSIHLKTLAACALTCMNFAATAHARQGGLDDSCGSGGKVTVSLGSSDDFGSAVVTQDDGKMLTAGTSRVGTQKVFALVRYNADGSLDTGFGTNGMVTTAIGTKNAEARGIALQSDGKILLAGHADNESVSPSSDDFALVRYHSNGSLDTSFGSGGKVLTSIGSGDDEAFGIVVQSDGKIVLAGTSFNGTQNVFSVVRYLSTGALDTSFNSTGKATAAFGTVDDSGSSVALQADGKILVAGYSALSATRHTFAVARFNANGSLDATFGGTGKVTTAIGSGLDDAVSLVIQKDGGILLAGHSHNGIRNVFAIVRLTATGALDTSFNATGKVTTRIGSVDDNPASVALQRDGKILVAGGSDDGAGHRFSLARYHTNGALDDSFNDTGILTTSMGGDDDSASGMAVQANGKIVIAGSSRSHGSYDFALARVQGNRDPNWVSDDRFGELWDTGEDWYGGGAYGWMWFEPGGQWIWSSSLQGWMASTGTASGTVWSAQFRWLTPSHSEPFEAESSSLGHIHIGKHHGVPISDGWVVSDRYGYVWAAGDSTWFFSATRGWLGVTPTGGVWCVNEHRFIQ